MRTLACLLLLVAVAAPRVVADNALPQQASSEVRADDHHTAESGDAEQQRKVGKATAGVLILVGVAVIGLLLIAAAMIWGAMVRRLVRHVEAEPSRQDELWYLRKECPSSEEPATETTGEEISPAKDSP